MLESLVRLSQEFLQTKNQRFRRYFIQNIKLDERFSILKGQRGIGKTTTMVQYLLDFAKQDRFSSSILYIQADHFALGTMALYENGDFLVDNNFLFEIGGQKKGFGQIRDTQTAYVAADGIETGFGNKIPLWLFILK